MNFRMVYDFPRFWILTWFTILVMYFFLRVALKVNAKVIGITIHSCAPIELVHIA